MNKVMDANEVSAAIVDAALKIHRELGPGLLESVYETVLEYELCQWGLTVWRQHGIPVVYQSLKFDDGFRADLIVEGKVIIEIKSLDHVPNVAYKVLLTYLRLSGMRIGLLINFREELLKNGIKRIIN